MDYEDYTLKIPFGAKDSGAFEYTIPKGYIAEIKDGKVIVKKDESEDEKIRKELITHCRNTRCVTEEGAERISKWIAWLEKQGEQKPVIKMKTPEESLGVSSNEYNKFVDECIYGDDKSTWSKPELKEKEQKPSEWSVEDILMLSSCIEIMLTVDSTEEQQNWLKSLKDRYTWKPSDEQIEILEMVLTNESMDDNVAGILRELREQLKKLKG